VSAELSSQLPEYAKGAHGDLAQQQRNLAQRVAVQESVADLARQKACLACHGVDKRIVGPAFKEIAARYKGQDGIEGKLIEKLKRGGGGTWGQVPMPANPELSEQDARALIRWVLAGTE
jgi:cytochrome c